MHQHNLHKNQNTTSTSNQPLSFPSSPSKLSPISTQSSTQSNPIPSILPSLYQFLLHHSYFPTQINYSPYHPFHTYKLIIKICFNPSKKLHKIRRKSIPKLRNPQHSLFYFPLFFGSKSDPKMSRNPTHLLMFFGSFE